MRNIVVFMVYIAVINTFSTALNSSITDIAVVCSFNEGAIYTAPPQTLNFTRILQDLDFPMTSAYDHIEQKLYFTQYDGYLISKCNLDGSNIEVVLSNMEDKDTTLFTVQAFTLNIEARVIYFSATPAQVILRRDIDGGNITLTASDVISPRAITYYQNRIFWTDSEIGVIRSCDEDGDNLITHVWALKEPWGLYIDPCEEKFYWTDIDLQTVERADFRGSQREILTGSVNSDSVSAYLDFVYFVDRQTHQLFSLPKNGTGEVEEVGGNTDKWDYPSHILIYTEFPCGPVLPTAPSLPSTEPTTMTTPHESTSNCSSVQQTTDQFTTIDMATEQTTDNPDETNRLIMPLTVGVCVSVMTVLIFLVIVACSRRTYRLKRSVSHNLHKKEKNRIKDEKESVRVSVQFRLWAKDALKITFNTSSIRVAPPPECIDPLQFPRNRLTLNDELGSGAFGTVYKAEAVGVNQGDSRIVAVKKLKEPTTDAARSDFLKEVELYKTFDHHPNIISMLGYCTEEEPMLLIMEFALHGNLKSYLDMIRIGGTNSCQQPTATRSLGPNDVLTFAYQIANGMEYLSSKTCVHRDLAARNILLGEDMVCKLSDFGLARDLAGELQYEMKSEGRVPVRWMAPESVFYNIYTSQSDVWSFGILLWELVTLGSHPYPGMSSRRLAAKIQEGYRLKKPPHCSDEMYSIMYDCWHEDPHQRPSFHVLYRTITKMLEDAQDYLEMGDFDATDYLYLTPMEVTGHTPVPSRANSDGDSDSSDGTATRYVGEPRIFLKP